jgi:hypothetical protein
MLSPSLDAHKSILILNVPPSFSLIPTGHARAVRHRRDLRVQDRHARLMDELTTRRLGAENVR